MARLYKYVEAFVCVFSSIYEAENYDHGCVTMSLKMTSEHKYKNAW